MYVLYKYMSYVILHVLFSCVTNITCSIQPHTQNSKLSEHVAEHCHSIRLTTQCYSWAEPERALRLGVCGEFSVCIYMYVIGSTKTRLMVDNNSEQTLTFKHSLFSRHFVQKKKVTLVFRQSNVCVSCIYIYNLVGVLYNMAEQQVFLGKCLFKIIIHHNKPGFRRASHICTCMYHT